MQYHIFSPYRVCPLGAHVDYQHGLVTAKQKLLLLGRIVIVCFIFLVCGCNKMQLEVESDVLVEKENSISDDDVVVFPDLSIHQSMVFYNNLACFIMPETGSLKCDIYDLETKNILSSLSLPYDGYLEPHANTTCLGSHRRSEGSVFPALYVSAWNNQRQAFVYDISFVNGLFKAELIQVIDPSFISGELIGYGCLDWVVDGEGGRLFSIAYGLESSSRIKDGNSTIITEFRLPSLNEKLVRLSASDMVDHFDLPVINVFQDKFYLDDHLYVVAGMPDIQQSFPPKLCIIDLENKTLCEYSIPFSGEPEGLCHYQGVTWLNMYGSSNVFNLNKFYSL